MSKEISPFTLSAEKALRETAALHTKTAQMLYAYTHGHPQEAYEMALENERDAERLVLAYRDLPICTGRPTAQADVQAIMEEEIPLSMGFTQEGWFYLHIPELLPLKEKGKGSVKYIRSYLYPALDRFFRQGCTKCFDRCVIIYRHIYDRRRPEKACRDHDNIEVNFVTDALALYVMKDDAPLRCQHHYCSAEGDRNYTQVYVVPEHDFLMWYQMFHTPSEEG